MEVHINQLLKKKKKGTYVHFLILGLAVHETPSQNVVLALSQDLKLVDVVVSDSDAVERSLKKMRMNAKFRKISKMHSLA